MISLLKNKQGDVSSDKTIIYLIVALALVLILAGLFLYGGDLTRLAKNLMPQYTTSSVDTDEEIAVDPNAKFWCQPENIVADLVDGKGRLKDGVIKIKDSKNTISGFYQIVGSNIYDGTIQVGKTTRFWSLEFYKNLWQLVSDPNVGAIRNKIVLIDTEIMDLNKNDWYKKELGLDESKKLFFLEDFQKINGSEFVSMGGKNFLCRRIVQK